MIISDHEQDHRRSNVAYANIDQRAFQKQVRMSNEGVTPPLPLEN